MKTFKDNAGRVWSVSINTSTIKRVRDLCKIDLLEIIGNKTFVSNLLADPVQLVDIVYVVCKPEADARSITDEQFGEAMAGDAIDHATTALLEELADFFRSGQRKALRMALSKVREAEEISLTRCLTKLSALDVKSLLPKDPPARKKDTARSSPEPTGAGDSSTNSPAQSGSTPQL